MLQGCEQEKKLFTICSPLHPQSICRVTCHLTGRISRYIQSATRIRLPTWLRPFEIISRDTRPATACRDSRRHLVVQRLQVQRRQSAFLETVLRPRTIAKRKCIALVGRSSEIDWQAPWPRPQERPFERIANQSYTASGCDDLFWEECAIPFPLLTGLG